MPDRRAEDVLPEPVATSGTTSRRRAARETPRVVARPIALTREEEYGFIRSDLRRLVVTAGSLLGVMLLLLLVLGR